MTLITSVLVSLLTSPVHATLPDPAARKRELKVLSGQNFGALTRAITDYDEVPSEDRAKSPAAERALTRVRAALKTLKGNAAKLPIHAGMSDAELARALKGVRVADAFCNIPVISFFITEPGRGMRIQPHYDHDSAPTLEEVRAQNPGCTVESVRFSSSPAAAR